MTEGCWSWEFKIVAAAVRRVFGRGGNLGLQLYLRKAYRNSSSEKFPELLSDVHLVASGTGSAEIRETNVISTKRLASSAVVTSFIEASSAPLAYINLLDVGSTKRLTASTKPTALCSRR